MVRRRQPNKRDRSPGAALGESVPSTPHVGPRFDGGVGHGLPPMGDDEEDHGALSAEEDHAFDTSAGSAPSQRQSTEEGGDLPQTVFSEGAAKESPPLPPLPIITPRTQVTINVGGRLFTTMAGTLCKEPSLLAADVVSYFGACLRDEEGYPFYDRDPENFAHILNYLRGYPVMLGADEARHLAQDAVYFDIKGLRQATGADPSRISWTFQPGPGVSPCGKGFHSTEVVSLLGAGPLLPGETSVVFFKIEKHSQVAIGLVPPTIPLDTHFGQHSNTICYDSAGEVTCTVVTDVPPLPLPPAVSALLPRLLAHDLTTILGVSGGGALAAYGLDTLLARAASTSSPTAAGAGGGGGPASAGASPIEGGSGASPTLLAVGDNRLSPSEFVTSPQPYNLTGAPSLTLELTAPLARPQGVASPTTAPAQQQQQQPPPRLSDTVMSPFVAPQPLPPLQPRGDASLQPSLVPPMPSPMVQGMAGGPSPALGPSAVSVPDTPLVGPLAVDVHGVGLASAPSVANASAVSNATASAAIDAADPLGVLPILTSNVCPTSAAVPRVKDGDELCVVSHLSEDGTCAVVRFYRHQQLLHAVVAFGKLLSSGGASSSAHRRRARGVFDSEESDDDDDEDSDVVPRQSLVPAGLNDDSSSGAAKQIRAATGGSATLTAHYEPRQPLPPLQLALYARSSTTVFTSDTRTVKKDSGGARGGGGAGPPSASVLPPPSTNPPIANQPATRGSGNAPAPSPPSALVPTTPLTIITTTLQQQQLQLQRQQQQSSPVVGTGRPALVQTAQHMRANEEQFQGFIRLFPDVVAQITAAAATPMPNSGDQPTLGTNHYAVRDCLAETLMACLRQLMQAHDGMEGGGLYEYFHALPRFYAVVALDDESLSTYLATEDAGESTANANALYPLSNTFQSIVVASVRSVTLNDSTLTGTARRHRGDGIRSAQELEDARASALRVSEEAYNGRRRPPQLWEMTRLFLRRPSELFDQLPPTTRGRGLVFVSARDLQQQQSGQRTD